MPIDYQALNTELTTDPNSYGYAPYVASGSDGVLADMLNQVRPGISVPRADVTPLEILEAINVSDFLANANTYWSSWFESLTQFASVRVLKQDGSDTRVMSNILKFLSNGSASETRIRALATRNGSRAEQLFGTAVTPYDVGHALGTV